MTSAPQVVTIFGGSGFVGRYIAHRMARAGWRVRVAVRRPNEAIFVKQYGDVGQVETILANVRDDASTRRAIEGADAVVFCVGVLWQSGKQKFDVIHHDAAERVARLASEAGVSKLIHLSAIGADAESSSRYAQSKAAGEAAVRAAFPAAVILRPSVVFGTEDEFFNRFAAMARLFPILPVIGASTKFQPVYVEDIALAAEKILSDNISNKTFELGGPEVATFRTLMEKMLRVIYRKRPIINLPVPIARAKAMFFEAGSFLTGGLFAPMFTRDQVAQLQRDNVVAVDAAGFADLGIEPQDMDSVLESYLYCYRPKGQYSELTRSGKNLRA